MAYKTIVAVLSTAADTTTIIEHALALAQRFDAHLIGIHAEMPIVVTVAAPMEYPDTGAILALQEQAQEESRRLERTFRSRCEQAGLSHEWRLFTGSAGYAASGIIDSARGADLVVAGQLTPDFDGPSRADIEDLLYESGRPLYIASGAKPQPGTAARVLIAWNGSKEAARAAFDALPFLKEAAVEILCVDPKETRVQSADFCGAELAATLSRHGVDVTVNSIASGGEPVAAAINRRAGETGTGLIVMGAYSHSRLRERLLGGVTRAMMRELRVPALMSR
ncbi:MAG: universal stress protein [Shinella sp.]|nr:universal stress protein [Shinella sp.]